MEYGLGRFVLLRRRMCVGCLNPCFNGIWSRTAKTINYCCSALWLSFRDRNGQFLTPKLKPKTLQI